MTGGFDYAGRYHPEQDPTRTGGFDNGTGQWPPQTPNAQQGHTVIDRIVARHALTFARKMMAGDLQAISAVMPLVPEPEATGDEVLEYAMQVAVRNYLRKRIKDLDTELDKLNR